MKKIIITAACLIVIFSSCKKQTDTSPVNNITNTITANVDGVAANFSTNASFYISATEPGENPNALVINGSTGTGSTKTLITIVVSSENLITSGTFPSADTNPEPVTSSQIIYEPTIPDAETAEPYITNNFVQNSTTVTISTISSTNVQGTFSGALIYSISGTDMTAETITNGKFNLTIK